MSLIYLLFGLFLSLGPAFASTGDSELSNALAEDSEHFKVMSAITHVETDQGAGTGFFYIDYDNKAPKSYPSRQSPQPAEFSKTIKNKGELYANNSRLFIITNKYVIKGREGNIDPKYIRVHLQFYSAPSSEVINEIHTLSSKNKIYIGNKNLVAIDISEDIREKKNKENKVLKYHAFTQSCLLRDLRIVDFSSKIFILGYPFLDSKTKPVLRQGSLASLEDNLIDCNSVIGFSGAPVLLIKKPPLHELISHVEDNIEFVTSASLNEEDNELKLKQIQLI